MNAGNLSADLIGCPGRLVGQVFNFTGNNGKPLAGIPGPGRLDGRIEGQKISLFGDIGNQFYHLTDLLGRFDQTLNHIVGPSGFFDGVLRYLVGLADLTADFGYRTGQFLGRRGNGLHIGRGFFRRRRHRHRLLGGLLGSRGHTFGSHFHGIGSRSDLFQ